MVKERVKIGRKATGKEIYGAILEASKAVASKDFYIELRESYRYEPGSVKRIVDSFSVLMSHRVNRRRGFGGLKREERWYYSVDYRGIHFPQFLTDQNYEEFEIELSGPWTYSYDAWEERALTREEETSLREKFEKFLEIFYERIYPSNVSTSSP